MSADAATMSSPVMSRVLYITYDGVLEPLGQSQVFQYLRRLSSRHAIELVSYEKARDWAQVRRRHALQAEMRAVGIRWYPLRYHKAPSIPVTAYDVVRGFCLCAMLVLRRRIIIVHARGYVPALLALALKRMFGTRFIFDMRGFWADEKVAADEWAQGSRLYRATKWCERQFLARADVVVSLTHAAVAAMQSFDYLQRQPPHFEVIPTCVDTNLFRPSPGYALVSGQADSRRPFTLGYVGSVGSRYLFDRVLECFAAVREQVPSARLLVVNRDRHPYIWERVRRHGIAPDTVEVKSADYVEMAAQINRMDAGLFLYRTGVSTLATAPTKLGEFLACGVPCLANAGIGDVESIFEHHGVGVILREWNRESCMASMQRLIALATNPAVRRRCVEVARGRFSLEGGVNAYDNIYVSLAGQGSPCRVVPPPQGQAQPRTFSPEHHTTAASTEGVSACLSRDL